ncbi:ABC transporter permease [Gulosibacter sp. ACHW.36C]|uniref:FtsX-like permease family protein n=1 Tax=Gulosibacter sediminis TaxID=1729695 RepID=A0ABY4MWJ9_9MICO|nr:FtsX-like permease family protein [Gulosibacter sediminis]UQN14790.1 FtsX-like permease family protein [Gulosibacter sediminis]
MFWTYLRRELRGRKKQTVIVSIGLAIAVALVIVVNSLSSGVRAAQAQSLQAVYGIGTDLTVTGAQAEPGSDGGGPQFDFGSEDSTTSDDGSTTLDQSQLQTDMMRGTLDASTLETVLGIDGVSQATGTLSLTNSTFSGELPDMSSSDSTTTDGTTTDGTTTDGSMTPPDGGGGGGFGGGQFGVDSFSVLGIDPASVIGPMSSVSVTDGRLLTPDDNGTNVAVLDSTYATSAELAVGDTLEVGGEDFEVVGIVSSTNSDADTASNVYIPLDVAQDLSGAGDVVSTVYVQTTSSDNISTVQTTLETELPDATVSSQSDLASTVSGSLSTASNLITNLGTWLSIIVLLVAVGLAVLFTTSGIARRTRELGTLKAIGWSNGRIVRQVAGESMVQSLIGGVAGLAVGLIGILTINVIAPTISAGTEAQGAMGGGEAGGAPGGGGGAPDAIGQAVSSATTIVLQAPLSVWVLVLALSCSVAAGVITGIFGGWRAARLSPAESLRAVG